MKLYHGTSDKYLEKILKDGLLPRRITKQGNWHGPVISKPDFVYLSTAYPVYFALHATNRGQNLLIVEVDVELDDLYPDEDFCAVCMQHWFPRFASMPLKEVNPHVDMEAMKHVAESSLKYNGNVAVKGVSPDRITRHVVIPFAKKAQRQKTIQAIMNIGGDSMPNYMNYSFLGPAYRKAVQVLFDEGLEAAEKAKMVAMGYTDEVLEQLKQDFQKVTA